jgi:mannose-6-phosphate isomerase-like protein (cupin superfamily)
LLRLGALAFGGVWAKQERAKMHIRRVVTANGADGKSRVIFDGAPGNTIEPVPGLKLSDIWETAAPPTIVDGTTADNVARPIRLDPARGGTIFKVVTYPPVGSFPEDAWAKVYEEIAASEGSNEGGAMHKTKTIDFVVCIEGEISCVLETEVVTLRPGDTLVQLGSNHGWENRTDKPATIIGVMIDNSHD